MRYAHCFTFITALLTGIACNGPVKKELPKEQQHPKLVKTIGNANYGHVRCGLQDKEGNLWFGTTENGLYKYDGQSFHQFLEADGLISNSINDILEDKDGKIWVGTKAGVCIYDTSASPGRSFSHIQIPVPKNLPPNKNRFYQTQVVQDMMQDKTGKLWFVTIDGVYVYDGKSFTLFEIKEAANGVLSSNDKAERVLEDNAGNIWFGGRTNEGAYRYDGKTITKLKLEQLFQNGPTPKPHNWGWPQLQDKKGNIWFSNWGGAYRYDPSANSVTGFTKKDGLPGIVTCIIEDKNGNIWLGGDGICRYNPSASTGTGSKSFTCFTKKDGLVNPGVWSIMEDKAGNLWVGTWETSLYLYDGKTFTSYSEYKGQPGAN